MGGRIRMRVISGSSRGAKLFSPKGNRVRPTTDKIKESIFNIIQPIKHASIVLDLFSGTGGVGIEFISRGSEKCFFVDIDKESIQLIEKNILKCGLTNKSQVLKSDYEKAIQKLSDLNIKCDYIFADPPYEMNIGHHIIKVISDCQILSSEGLIIMELPREQEIKLEGMNYQIIKEKIYGITKIIFITEG
jgi:16S rRNA (guanine966-N2)-methyltransferase